MNNFLFIVAIITCSFFHSVAQISYGVTAGIQSGYFIDKHFYLDLEDGGNELLLKVNKGKYGLHFGGFTRLQIANLFIQPEVMFNSDNIKYTLKDLNKIDNPSTIYNERFYSVTIPLKIGLKRQLFNFHTGPVANYQLLSISELWHIGSFEKQFSRLTWSWMIGVGIDLRFVRLDFNIEQGLGDYGDHIQIEGRTYTFSKNPGRMVMGLYIPL